MARRLMLDTSVLIGLQRGRLPVETVTPHDDVALSIVAVAEYLLGVELARPQYRPRMQQFLDAWLDRAAVLPFDEEILSTHIKLQAWTHQHGCPRGQHDLIIAATAIATDRVLVTLDRKARFEQLPGLRVQLLESAP